jgi:hypothetical protein
MKLNLERKLVRITEISRPNRYNLINDIYFWFYIVFLAFRTFAVLFASANMNESARKPIELIRRVPTRYWSVDVRSLAICL